MEIISKNCSFFEVYEKTLTAGKAAQVVNIPRRTAYNLEDQAEIKKSFEDKTLKVVDNGGVEEEKKNPGRMADRKKYLEKNFGDNPSTMVDQALEGLKVSKATVHRFMTNECALSFKKAYFYSVERNSCDKIQERYEWVVRWSKTDLSYVSNCVFLDEAAFHINLKRATAWTKKGERAIFETPKTRAQTTSILGAISPFGIINVKVRRPYESSSKEVETVGTGTSDYFNFKESTLDIMDQHEQLRNFYLIMDNVSIHTHEDISRYIVNRGYRFVYLPPYSPELDPIE